MPKLFGKIPVTFDDGVYFPYKDAAPIDLDRLQSIIRSNTVTLIQVYRYRQYTCRYIRLCYISRPYGSPCHGFCIGLMSSDTLMWLKNHIVYNEGSNWKEVGF